MLIFLSKCRIGLFGLSSFNVSFNRWNSQKFYIPAPLSSFLQTVHNIRVKSVNIENHSLVCRYVRFAEFPRRLLQKSPFSEMWIHETGAKWPAFRRGLLSPVLNRRIIKKKAGSFVGNIRKVLSDRMTPRSVTRCLQVQVCILFNVYWTVHHCNSWRMKDQLDVTCYFISLLMCSTCFGH